MRQLNLFCVTSSENKKLKMVGPGAGLPPADGLLRTGELAAKAIVRIALLGTVHMWIGKWGNPGVTQEIVKQFAEADVFYVLQLLCEVCSLPAPSARHDSVNRTKGEQLAIDLYETVMELDKRGKLPEILVSSGDSER